MAISKKTKDKYNKYSGAYQESDSVVNAKNKLAAMAGKAPEYSGTYDERVKEMYNRVKSGKEFSYNPDNDLAYRRFADEYNALSGLAIAGNQSQAESLTGGYGSSYAPYVANQGAERLREGAQAAKPLFMEQAQKTYMENTDADIDALNAGINLKKDELNDYANRASAFNTQYDMAQKRYSDQRDFDYKKHSDSRDYWNKEYWQQQEQDNYNKELQFKKYDTYEKLASVQCAKYNDNKNNSGMKAYLNGLVKEGKLTKYQADNLYNQYKYTAPARSSGGGRGRSRTSGYTGGGDDVDNVEQTVEEFDGNDITDEFIYSHSSIVNRRVNLNKVKSDIKSLYEKGKLTSDEAEYLLKYYKDYGSETQAK